ncbi:MAG: hypothetical protein ACFB2W_23635 [Leptolyngbyaceae cyanobacterium]
MPPNPNTALPPKALMLQRYLYRPGLIPASIHPFVKQAVLERRIGPQAALVKSSQRFPWRGWLMLVGYAIASLSRLIARSILRFWQQQFFRCVSIAPDRPHSKK